MPFGDKLPKINKDSDYYNNTFLNNRNEKIHCYYWRPKTEPRALLFISHGYGEHCAIYEKLAKEMSKKGFFVFAHDQICHGLSEGSRGYITDTQHLINDTVTHIKMIKKDYPNLPLFICGHSMGGSIAILVSVKKEIDVKGMVLVAPAVEKNPETATCFKVTAAKLLYKLLPKLPIIEMDFHLICRNERNVEEMLRDPLRFKGKWKIGPAMVLLNMTEEVMRRCKEVKVPFLFLQGDNDKVCHIDGATSFHENAPSKDKTFKVYPGAYHCLFQDLDEVADDVLDQTIKWLESRA